MRIIDVNCDLGEGVVGEALLMPYISSCNIACGGHFGTKDTIDETIELAIKNKVKIGAHPSFPDQTNFGRKILNISAHDLKKSIQSQLELIAQRLEIFNVKMHHIKAHGALYNLIAKDIDAATNYINSIERFTKGVCVYVPYNSAIEKVAKERGINIKYEAFADRNYNTDMSLVSRSNKNAVISNPSVVFNHIRQMIENEKVLTIDKVLVSIKADTFCIHGDHKNALEILKEITRLLKKQNIQIA
ncbi:MAG: 5-oxoprolinase subunit PxpA [Flavobacteriaceae bacterium]|nr:5-oxoprolinase subunit PxpA [Flavobacteriaceae bacterium]